MAITLGCSPEPKGAPDQDLRHQYIQDAHQPSRLAASASASTFGKVLEIDPDADSQGNLVFPHALQYFR
jgi:hypothetical protein